MPHGGTRVVLRAKPVITASSGQGRLFGVLDKVFGRGQVVRHVTRGRGEAHIMTSSMEDISGMAVKSHGRGAPVVGRSGQGQGAIIRSQHNPAQGDVTIKGHKLEATTKGGKKDVQGKTTKETKEKKKWSWERR